MKNKKVTAQILFSQKLNGIHIQCLMNLAYIRNVIKVKRQNNYVHDMFFAKIYDWMFQKEQDWNRWRSSYTIHWELNAEYV